MLAAKDFAKPMDLRRIRHFVTLAETLNFHRAAERLHMAQPPLTVSIQKLEAELGTKLFLRESTGVSLTPSGRAVLIEAKKLLFHGTQLRESAQGAIDLRFTIAVHDRVHLAAVMRNVKRTPSVLRVQRAKSGH